jgi:hypothetical protein
MARHRHRKHNYSKKRTSKHTSNKNIINKTVGQGVSIVKSTSRKYMPKVKSGLENIGSTVVEKSVPYLQRLTRKFFGLFSGQTRKNRK